MTSKIFSNSMSDRWAYAHVWFLYGKILLWEGITNIIIFFKHIHFHFKYLSLSHCTVAGYTYALKWNTLVCLINEHVRLFFLEKKSTLCALIRQYSIIMIRLCAFINFLIFFHPVRLLSPVRLLGRLEYMALTHFLKLRL